MTRSFNASIGGFPTVWVQVPRTDSHVDPSKPVHRGFPLPAVPDDGHDDMLDSIKLLYDFCLLPSGLPPSQRFSQQQDKSSHDKKRRPQAK